MYLTGTIDAGWHLFGQDSGKGPTPATIKVKKNPQATLSGKITEAGKFRKAFEPNFKAELKFYENQVIFVQKVTVKDRATAKVTGSVEFMVCDDHQCLPPKSISFSIEVGGR